MFLVTVTHLQENKQPQVFTFPNTMYSDAHNLFRAKCEQYRVSDCVTHVLDIGYIAKNDFIKITFTQEERDEKPAEQPKEKLFQLTVKEPNGDITIFQSKSPVRAAHKFNTEMMRLKLSEGCEEKGETLIKMENGYHLEYKQI